MDFDVIVIGSGLAGLAATLELTARNRRVALVAKGAMRESASDRAQGGIAAPLAPEDSVEQHVRDTLAAGGGLCDEAATRSIVEAAGDAVAWLQEWGVAFTADPAGGLHLTREGGHGQRRIAHAADATGRAIVAALGERARRSASVTLLEHHAARDLIVAGPSGALPARCQGVRALDLKGGRQIELKAPHVILAAGGAGQVYLRTTTPASATGDAIAMAWRAGCRVANMEFMQFHPTCLSHPQGGGFLISEAVRGEGGLLRLPGGARFMPAYDPRAELAPRDIVARAIDRELRQGGLDCVYLDISHLPRAYLLEHFPTIHAHCLALGIDIATTPIPVAPAAHYTCGGIVTDAGGRSDLAGLYAAGEAACTGLHGANRLASNSLLECVVTGRAAARTILGSSPAAQAAPAVPATDGARGGPPCAYPPIRQRETPGNPCAAALRDALRRLMTADAGIVRSDASLARASARIAQWRADIEQRHLAQPARLDWLELRNLAQVAELIVSAASARRESRGGHFNADWPAPLPSPLPSVLAWRQSSFSE